MNQKEMIIVLCRPTNGNYDEGILNQHQIGYQIGGTSEKNYKKRN
jgi:hypothetical protein